MKAAETGSWVWFPGHRLNDELCLTLVSSVGSEVAAFKISSNKVPVGNLVTSVSAAP